MKKTYFFFILFVATIVSAQQPTYIWAKAFQRTSNSGGGNAITVDQAGNVYTTGGHDGLNFDPAMGMGGYKPTAGGYDAFIAKLDNAGNYLWAGNIGGGAGDFGYDITTDLTGNVYACGVFLGNSDLDPTLGVYPVTSQAQAGYVVKLDASGNLIWGVSISGTQSVAARSIRTDVSDNVFVTGHFAGTVDLDPGPGVYTVTSAGQSDVFLLKLSPAGTFIYAKIFGGSGVEESWSVTVDNTASPVITGFFSNTVDLDPGIGSYTAASNGLSDIFVSKFDNSGNFVWALAAGSSSNDIGSSVTHDPFGNIYVCGTYQGTISVGSSSLSYGGMSDMFFLKLTPTGNYSWINRIGSNSDEMPQSISSDGSGNIYSTGYFTSQLDFDPGLSSFTLAPPANGSAREIFINKLDSTGAFKWAVRMGNGPTIEYGASVFVDSDRSVHSTGRFIGNVDFNPGPATNSIIPQSNNYNYPYVHKMCQVPDRVSSISGNTLVCWGTTNVFSINAVSTATAYSWTLPTSWIGSSSLTTLTSTVMASANLSVTSSNACGSSPAGTLFVQVSPSPTISVNSGSICPGANFTIIPGGAASYTYSSGSSIVSPSITSTYTVMGTSSLGCISSSPVISTVGLYVPPSITVSSGSVCLGNTFTLLPSGAVNYTFSSGSPVVSPLTTTSYSISGISNVGCLSNSLAIATVSVYNYPLPVIAVNSGSICKGEIFTITPTGADTYTITGGIYSVAPQTTSNYSITGSSSNGCISNQPAVSTVIVNALPTVTISHVFSNLCVGEEFEVTASGAQTYQWNDSITGVSYTSVAIPLQTLTVVGTNSNGCIGSYSLSLLANECTGLMTNSVLNFQIFPNPASRFVNIELGSRSWISIYDNKGQKMREIELQTGRHILDLTRMDKGLYTFIIETDHSQYFKKIAVVE